MMLICCCAKIVLRKVFKSAVVVMKDRSNKLML